MLLANLQISLFSPSTRKNSYWAFSSHQSEFGILISVLNVLMAFYLISTELEPTNISMSLDFQTNTYFVVNEKQTQITGPLQNPNYLFRSTCITQGYNNHNLNLKVLFKSLFYLWLERQHIQRKSSDISITKLLTFNTEKQKWYAQNKKR